MVVSAAIMVGGAVVGGAMKANGAKKAAGTQAAAATEDARIRKEAADAAAAKNIEAGKIRSDAINAAGKLRTEAIGTAGEQAIFGNTEANHFRNNALIASTGQLQADAEKAQTFYESTLQTGTQDQIRAAKDALDAVTSARDNASASFAATTGQVNKDYWDAAGRAKGYINDSTTQANTTLKDMYETNKGMYDPYMTTGLEANSQLAAGIAPGGDFTHRFDETDMVKDGGYKFRLNEGLTAVENSAAGRGGLLSGNTLRGLTDYSQGFASHEYDKAYGRFNTDMDTRFSRLSSLANRGMDATGKVVDLGTGYARDASTNLTNAGRANAGIETEAAQYTGNNTLNSGRYTADNLTANGLSTGQSLRDIGQISADAHERWGQTRGDMILKNAALEAGKITGVGNNNADLSAGVGQIRSDGTLAIGNTNADTALGSGNATADALLGAAGATERGAQAQGDGVIGAGNAISAGQAGAANAYGNAVTQAANSFTSFYSMNKKPPT